MVGVVRDIVIPLKGAGTDPVFTIVCEILTTPAISYPYEESEQKPHVTRLWKMASAWRVISFFLVVFVLPTVLISLPLYARYHLYHARHLPMTETDTRALNYAVSSFWCQGQRVTSNGTLDAFLVAGSPRVQEQRRHVTLRRTLTLRHDDVEYWGVYLLEGSTFALSSNARWPGGTLLVVRGEDNLRKCFYREERLEEELNGGKSPALPNIYKGLADMEADYHPHVNNPYNNNNNHNHNNNKHQDDVEEEEEGGGEVFDEDVSNEQIAKLELKPESQELVDQDDDDLVSIMEESKKHKYDFGEKKSRKSKQKGERRKNKKGKKKDKEGRKEKHERTKRSLLSERLRRDVSQPSNSATHPEVSSGSTLDKFNILHKFNDTLEVTAGNSSISSSEEFLEQCRNTILTVDLSPYPDWDIRVLNLKSSNPDAWNFIVNATDYYYFIFTSDNSIEFNELGFNLELERATYDVSSPIEACRNSTECVFPLSFTQTESVVVEVPAGENLHELHSFEVTTTCQPRVPVYMVFILLVPFIILLFAFQ